MISSLSSEAVVAEVERFESLDLIYPDDEKMKRCETNCSSASVRPQQMAWA